MGPHMDSTSLNNLFDKHEGRIVNIVLSSKFIPIQRYNIQEDKIYGDPANEKVRYKILRVSGNDVVYKDITTDKVKYSNVNELLELWNLLGYKEITNINGVLALIKKYLSPLLGSALIGSLIGWLLNKLGAKK